MSYRNKPYTLEELKELYDSEYIEVVEYHGAKNILCRCKLCGEVYHVETSNLERKQIHRKCVHLVYGASRRNNKYTLSEVKVLYDNEYTDIIKYIDAKHVRCLCKICSEEYTTSIQSLRKGNIHRKCYTKFTDGRCTEEKLKDKLLKLQQYGYQHGDILEYYDCKNVVVKCRYCGEIVRTTSRGIRNQQVHLNCPEHQVSKGEKRIAEILDSLDITYYQEFRFDDCRNQYLLRFDFYTPRYNVCIEYQGDQHYHPVIFPKDTKESAIANYNRTVKNDNIKVEYCKSHNIKLLVIKYTQYDELYELLDDYFSKII